MRFALNLAYMNEVEAHEFQFNQESVALRIKQSAGKGLL